MELFGQCPPIEKMDAALSNLKACKHLSLSTNNIGKITSLAGMENLEILSVGRNQLRSLDVDGVSDTLQELWASYNLVGSLAGVEKLQKLRTLYVSNNNIKSIDEVNRLADLEHLEDVLFINNPFFNDFADKAEYRLELLRRLPKLKKIDGVPVDVEEREAAAAKRPLQSGGELVAQRGGRSTRSRRRPIRGCRGAACPPSSPRCRRRRWNRSRRWPNSGTSS